MVSAVDVNLLQHGYKCPEICIPVNQWTCRVIVHGRVACKKPRSKQFYYLPRLYFSQVSSR